MNRFRAVVAVLESRKWMHRQRYLVPAAEYDEADAVTDSRDWPDAFG